MKPKGMEPKPVSLKRPKRISSHVWAVVFVKKNGYCVTQDDDMAHEIYPLLRAADAVVLASPIYFYNVTAQLKAPIDRSQTLWARKYKLESYRSGTKLQTWISPCPGGHKREKSF